jgi:hypothetical protein
MAAFLPYIATMIQKGILFPIGGAEIEYKNP